jgi:NAD+ kinase
MAQSSIPAIRALLEDRHIEKVNTQAPASILESRLSKIDSSTMSKELLRDYLAHLEPLDLESMPSPESIQEEARTPFSAASTKVGDDYLDLAILPSSGKFPFNAPKSFLNHRKQGLSNDAPQQSILQALATQTQQPRTAPISIATSLANSLNARRHPAHSRNTSNVTTKLLTAASPDLTVPQPTPSTARFASIQSPCFYHQRFDDAVNIDRVLEEIDYEADGMSTSRLMQTATSVREISKQLQRRAIKKPIRSIMIVTKARDNSLVYLTRELALWLLSTPRYGSDVGVNVYVDAKLRKSQRFDAPGILSKDKRFEKMLRYWDPDLCWSNPEKFDLVLTLGGDGTVLFTSFCLFQRVVPPVLAFSLGSLGFLTNFEYGTYRDSLNNIMGDAGMRVNLRMRFTCTVFRANPNRPRGTKVNPINTSEMIEGEKFEVLNELVIDRGPSAYVSNLELYGDDELMTVVQADGCIISTPTGSTAYALSAGGPLTHPSIPGMVLAPICPHTLSFRPMVLSDSIQLKVCVPRNSRSTAYASFDGKNRVELRRGDCIQVEAGKYPFPTVVGEHGTGGEWFESVRRALRWNTRGAMQKSFNSSKQPAAKAAPLEEDPVPYTDDEEENEEEETCEEWDIDPDVPDGTDALDSGVGTSIASSCASPRRQNSLNVSP